MPAVVERSPAERAAIRDLARAELARRSFLDFLGHVQVRSDDPLNPVITKWEAWPYLVEQAEAWASGASEVDLKDRQLGYSWLAASYAVWRARNGAAVALISKGQLEARELLAKCAFVERHLPWGERGTACRVDDIRYPAGGVIMAFPSTPDAGVSFTFQIVIMDEAHFHPYAASNYAAIRPTISAGGQFIILSTADPSLGPNGWFPEMYWASKRGETGYVSRFIPWHVRPGRDRAWLERERAAYHGMPEEFDAYYAETDAQAFTGKTGLVYPMFSEARHVLAEHPWAWADSKRKVAGVDFGGGDPTACPVLGLSGTKQVHQFAEFYQRGAVGVEDIAAFLKQWPGPGVAYCDPSEPVAIEDLTRALRGSGWTATAADNRRGEGLGFVGWLLEGDRITIHASCRDSIAEFPGYRWTNRTDPNDQTRYATGTPVDHHADGMDGRRYGVMALLDDIRGYSNPAVYTLDGSRRRTTAV